jgi:hypothetical protein
MCPVPEPQTPGPMTKQLSLTSLLADNCISFIDLHYDNKDVQFNDLPYLVAKLHDTCNLRLSSVAPFSPHFFSF